MPDLNQTESARRQLVTSLRAAAQRLEGGTFTTADAVLMRQAANEIEDIPPAAESHAAVMEISHWTERFDPACIVFRVSGYNDMESQEVTPKHRFEIQRSVWQSLGCPEKVLVVITAEKPHA